MASGAANSGRAGEGERIREAVAYLRRQTGLVPRAGVVLGTGLGSLPSGFDAETVVPYEKIPHFPCSEVESHANELVLGRLGEVPVAFMRGRIHYYEGFSMQEVTFPIRVLRGLGASTLVISGAVGGMNPLYSLGEIVLVADHINLMGDNPLIGPNDESLGPRFPDMSEPYDRGLRRTLQQIALEQAIPLSTGVLIAVAGPNLETRAEYRFLRWCGADVVGMSIVPENLVAVHGGMKVAALSVVTDLCLPDALEPADVSKILAAAASAAPQVSRLITGLLERLPEEGPSPA
ncbi:MAG: purine-nucleoside phosphorylase [Candidatus Eisenbacteria bacterium]|nr:purine-nucleoside phosphorylase [Candidatus Eisenbacteria bacterium]